MRDRTDVPDYFRWRRLDVSDAMTVFAGLGLEAPQRAPAEGGEAITMALVGVEPTVAVSLGQDTLTLTVPGRPEPVELANAVRPEGRGRACAFSHVFGVPLPSGDWLKVAAEVHSFGGKYPRHEELFFWLHSNDGHAGMVAKGWV